MSRIEVLLSGACRPGDAGNSWEHLPDWFSREKFEQSRRVVQGNSFSNYFSTNIGVILASQLPSLMDPLIETGNICSVAKSQGRIARTFMYVKSWNSGNVFDPEDEAHKSLKKVKHMHKKVAELMNKTRPSERVWVSQLDMALTQFSIVGPIMLFPEKIGVYLNEEGLEYVAYFWRTIGYLLGIEDEYNLCTGTYREIHRLCWDIVDVIIKPSLSNPKPIYTECLENSFTGLKKFSSLIDYAAFVNWTYELIEFEERLPISMYGMLCTTGWKVAVVFLYFDIIRVNLSPLLRSVVHRRVNKHIRDTEVENTKVPDSFLMTVYAYVLSVVSVLKKLAIPNSLQEN